MGGSLRPLEVHPLRPWEEEQTFADALYHWMQRAPWLALSAAAHLLAFFVLMAVPWSAFQEEEGIVVSARPESPQEVFPDEPEEPQIVEDIAPLEDVEPTLNEIDPTEVDDPDADSDEPVADSDEQALDDTPFDEHADVFEVGIGGNAGGKYGERFGTGDGRGEGGGGGTQPALRAGLTWLAEHQDDDGKWDADEFMKHDPAGDACTGPGHATHDVGLTGLALLAFLGSGSTPNEGEYRDEVTRGLRWLMDQQDPDAGLLGQRVGHAFLYDHAIATLALCEGYYFTRSPLLRRSAQAAVGFCARARNAYGAWRYDAPGIGDNDTSVTGWMVFALASAKDAGLVVDPAAFEGALAWLDEVTDPRTGRCGYDAFGSLSSRTPANDHFPRERGEAMTAVALLSRFFLGQDPADVTVMERHADLLRTAPPEWDPEGLGCDMYHWYYGTYAMFQMGGRHWKAWNRAMKRAVLGSQRVDGAAAGSWDPVGPWGHAGGRVYSTAMMTLCLQVYFRYGRLCGTR